MRPSHSRVCPRQGSEDLWWSWRLPCRPKADHWVVWARSVFALSAATVIVRFLACRALLWFYPFREDVSSLLFCAYFQELAFRLVDLILDAGHVDPVGTRYVTQLGGESFLADCYRCLIVPEDFQLDWSPEGWLYEPVPVCHHHRECFQKQRMGKGYDLAFGRAP